MDQDEKDHLEAIFKKHPELVVINEAIVAFRHGQPITSRCPKCGQLLQVEYVEPIDTIWVKCAKGCTTYNQVGQVRN